METIEEYMNSKVKNFILYLEKIIGTNNKLYQTIARFAGNNEELIKYAELISKVCKINPNNKCKYYLEQSLIEKFLEENGFDLEKVKLLDDGKFITIIKRYLELFVNLLC